MPSAPASATRTFLADLTQKGISRLYPSIRDSINSMRLGPYATTHLLEGTVVPALQAVVAMQEQTAQLLIDTLRGERTYAQFMSDTWGRMYGGLRFNHLVTTWGRQLFGSARLPGEVVLVDDGPFHLVYMPAKKGVKQQVPLFHVGGAIPYGDRLFRLLPEANLYQRFTDRGMPVYAMELRGDASEVHYGKLTMADLVATIERLTAKAVEHAGQKVILEGYCGHGMQALAYLAARPDDAESKLAAVAFFVSPIHGPACTIIAEVPQMTPKSWTDIQLAGLEMSSGYVPGTASLFSLDLSLKKNFLKTPLGRFYDGWCQADLAKVSSIEELSLAQRKALAGAYWISPENANRFPIPADFARYATAMFSQGLSKSGELPFKLGGEPLSLAGFAARTNMPVFGFYGGTDPVIVDRTAYPLMKLLGNRYRHVVHPSAGHISYIFSPELWGASHRARLDPNPIDLILEAAKVGSVEANS